ncbi:Chloroperoxidase [Aspergillus egyptiacus]|nr:Chloroperoxidase [Aspergillus egyptiacus]
MKLALLSLAGLASANIHLGLHNLGHALAHDKNPHAWIPAGADDARSPCPMLNTLANQKYLPHDGRNISREAFAEALVSALNFDPTLAAGMFDNAIVANPEEGATHFDLDQLNTHNVLEHDASLSRSDAYFGNNHLFDPTIFAQTQQYWTDPSTLTIDMLANSKLARQLHSKAFNPTYSYPEATEQTSYNEMGFPIIAFGDMEKGTVRRDFVEYFFVNERLPTELGWVVRESPVTMEQMGGVAGRVAEAVKLVTGKPDGKEEKKRVRRGAHDFGGY